MEKKLSKKDWESIQQPIDYKKTGKVNPEFDRLYGHKTKNPFWGTERDPNKPRREYVKIKDEYDRHKNQMTEKEKSQYENHLKEIIEKIK